MWMEHAKAEGAHLMPHRPRSACTYPRCSALVRGSGRCPEHRTGRAGTPTTITASVAEAVEREFGAMLGIDRVKSLLSSAERIMAGESTTRRQEIMTPDGSALYMRRHFVSERHERPQVWVHEILLPDEDRAYHDHPWDYRTILLSGAYDEQTPEEKASFEQGDALERKGDSLHRLLVPSPVVTLFMTSKLWRKWGFMTERGWVEATEYLANQAER